MKRVLCIVALTAFVVTFAGLAMSQRLSPTIRDQAPYRPGSGAMNLIQPAPLQPSYCSPCLFYGGDGNPNSPNANGLWDNNSSYFGISGVVYSPVSVVKIGKCGGKCKWIVSGIGGNIEMYPTTPVIDSVSWSLVRGVTDGGTPAGTTTICSGTDAAPTLTDTGRLYFGLYEEWNVAASTGGTCPAIRPSHKHPIVWQTNAVNTSAFQLAYESNVSDWPSAPNAFGPPEPGNLSFFYSPAFGFPTFTNTNLLGFFPAFSTDIEGTLGK